MMNAFQNCSDTSDAVELLASQKLYLKPTALLFVSVQLPQVKLPGKTISNWEVMDKLKAMIKPIEFTAMKVSKSTLEFIRFECEIENKRKLPSVIACLDTRTIKLTGFPELLKVRAAMAKISFPSRHAWDSYFRDAKNMNEMKPGERPDTIHVSSLPCKWFLSKEETKRCSDVPSEYIFRKVFEVFGDVRCVDIPASDPYRKLMKSNISGIKTFSFGQDQTFEGYVQFKEYICFVKAMDALRGMKLLYKDGENSYTASIKVDFDRTRHLSDASIRRRRIEREKLMVKERELEERLRREQDEEEKKKKEERKRKLEESEEKASRRKKREEKRKHRELRKLKEREAEEISLKIMVEERKLLIAQRKLESIRLLDELFERVKEMVKQRDAVMKKESENKHSSKNRKEDKLRKKEMPFFYKKWKECARSCSPSGLEAAVKEVADEGRGLRATAKKFNIDKMTLMRRVNLCKEKKEATVFTTLYNKSQVFFSSEEVMLSTYLKHLVQKPDNESEMRNKLVDKYKSAQEQMMADQRTRLRSVLAASSTICRSLDAQSETSISISEESLLHEEDDYLDSWKGRRNLDEKNFHRDSKFNDQHWYHQKSYRGSYHYSRPYYHKNYYNSRFQHRGRFSGRRRSSYVPYWQRARRDSTYKQEVYNYADIGREYYRYFKKLAWGDKEQSPDSVHSKDHSPLPSKQPRSRSRSWSHNHSHSSHSTRTSKYSWSEDRDRSWSEGSLASYDYSHSNNKKSCK